jgi:hypothetical protein
MVYLKKIPNSPIKVIGISHNVKNKSTTAQVAFLYNNAG